MPAEVPETIKDIRDVEQKDVEGFDAILHLAGLSNDPLGDLNADLTYEINHHASVRLAELAKKAGHGGGDLLEIMDFTNAILEGTDPPLGIHATMDMTLPGLFSQLSIAYSIILI